MKLRFLDFLKGKKAKPDAKPVAAKTARPLNEGLQQTLAERWKKLDMISLFRLLKFSPKWSPEWMKGSIDFTMDYKYNIPFTLAFQLFYSNLGSDNVLVNADKYRPSIRNDRDRVAVAVNEAEEGGQPPVVLALRDTYGRFKVPAKKIANKVMALFGRDAGLRRLNRFVKCDDKANDITVLDPGNEDDLKLIFSAVRHFATRMGDPDKKNSLANSPQDVAGDFDQTAFDQAKAAANA